MKHVMYARFIPENYHQDLFNKLQQLKQGTKSVEEYYKDMEMIMLRADLKELEEQTMARFVRGLNYPIRKIVDFQPYKNMTELLHQATKAERHIRADFAYERNKAYYAARDAATAKDNEAQASTAKPGYKPPPKTQGHAYIGPTVMRTSLLMIQPLHLLPYRYKNLSHELVHVN